MLYIYICVFGHGMSVCIGVHDLCRIHVQVCIWCKMLWILSENGDWVEIPENSVHCSCVKPYFRPPKLWNLRLLS